MKKFTSDKAYRLAILRDRGGDLSKEWYVEYYVWDDNTEDLKRMRIKVPQSYQTVNSRKKHAAKLIEEINELLQNGFFLKNEEPKSESPQSVTGIEVITLIDGLTTYLQGATYLRERSLETYQTAVNKAEAIFGNEFLFVDFTPGHALQFRDEMMKSGNASSTANNTLTNLSRLYVEFGKRYNYHENPFKNIERLPETESSSANIAFTDEDRAVVEKYMRKNDPKLFTFTRYMYYAFIRPTELRRLTVAAFNQRNWLITIPGEKSKNRKTRVIHVITPLKKFVEIDGLSWNHHLFGADLQPGKVMAGRNLAYNRHLAVLKACNLLEKDYTLYSWRHSGVVNAYLSGVGIKALQDMLGHYSLEETAIYLKSLGLRIDPNIEKYSW